MSALNVREGKTDILYALETVRGDGVDSVWVEKACHPITPLQSGVDMGDGCGLVVLVGFTSGDGECLHGVYGPGVVSIDGEADVNRTVCSKT